MANKIWLGNALATYQSVQFNPDDNDGILYSLTVYDDEGHSQTIVTTETGSAKVIVEGLKAHADILKALNVAPWKNLTVEEDDVRLTLTSEIAGKPFYYDASACQGDTLVATELVANAGPYDWNTVANWSSGSLPGEATNDTVFVENATILYGLDQAARTYSVLALQVSRSQIGQRSVDNLPASYLKIKVSKVDINYNFDANGSAFPTPVNIDTSNSASNITVYNGPLTQAGPAVNLKTNSSTASIQVLFGTVGIANGAGDTTVVGTISVLGGSCYIGESITLTTLLVRNGDVIVRCGMTTCTLENGILKTDASGAITTLNVNGGIATLNSAGAITNLNVINGIADMLKSAIARTVTTAKVGRGGVLKYDPATTTITNKVQLVSSSGELSVTAL